MTTLFSSAPWRLLPENLDMPSPRPRLHQWTRAQADVSTRKRQTHAKKSSSDVRLGISDVAQAATRFNVRRNGTRRGGRPRNARRVRFGELQLRFGTLVRVGRLIRHDRVRQPVLRRPGGAGGRRRICLRMGRRRRGAETGGRAAQLNLEVLKEGPGEEVREQDDRYGDENQDLQGLEDVRDRRRERLERGEQFLLVSEHLVPWNIGINSRSMEVIYLWT